MAVGKLALPAGGSGGGATGLQKNAILTGAGTQFTVNASIVSRTDSLSGYGVGAAENHTFVQMEAGLGHHQYVGIKSDGTLWYWSADSTYMNGTTWMNPTRTWTQYGTDTDWEKVSGGLGLFMFIKGGQLWFVGQAGERNRGDGSISTATAPIAVNTAYTWVDVHVHYRATIAITSDGWMFSCGYNYNYMLGLGGIGSTPTLTREQTNRTDFVSAGSTYRGTILLTNSGNLYYTGTNSSGLGGPLLGSGDINGPALGYNGGNIAFISRGSPYNVYAIDTDTKLRFAGNASGSPRIDNITASLQFGNSYQVIDSGSTGWSYVSQQSYNNQSWENGGAAIKNGNVLVGGVSNSSITGEFGATANYNNWITAYNSGNATALAVNTGRIMVSCS